MPATLKRGSNGGLLINSNKSLRECCCDNLHCGGCDRSSHPSLGPVPKYWEVYLPPGLLGAGPSPPEDQCPDCSTLLQGTYILTRDNACMVPSSQNPPLKGCRFYYNGDLGCGFKRLLFIPDAPYVQLIVATEYYTPGSCFLYDTFVGVIYSKLRPVSYNCQKNRWLIGGWSATPYPFGLPYLGAEGGRCYVNNPPTGHSSYDIRIRGL